MYSLTVIDRESKSHETDVIFNCVRDRKHHNDVIPCMIEKLQDDILPNLLYEDNFTGDKKIEYQEYKKYMLDFELKDNNTFAFLRALACYCEDANKCDKKYNRLDWYIVCTKTYTVVDKMGNYTNEYMQSLDDQIEKLTESSRQACALSKILNKIPIEKMNDSETSDGILADIYDIDPKYRILAEKFSSRAGFYTFSEFEDLWCQLAVYAE